MNIRHLIKQLAPLAISQKYMKKNSFATNFKKSGYDENCEIPEEVSKYKTIVSVQGFGYSGSGALIDFMREYPSLSVLGWVDTAEDGGGVVPKSTQYSEIDFIRLSGGLFEIEKFLDSDNVFLNDALLNRTTKCFGSSSLYKKNEHIRDIMYRFFANVAVLRLENLSQPLYNSYTVGLNDTPDIYFLRKMKRDEYVSLCRRFISSVFNEIHQEGHDTLVVDQLLADQDLNIQRNKEYIPNLKMILVARDPRDTYIWGIKKNVEWIEHRSVYKFIEWYKQQYANVNPSNNELDCLIVRYENLVLDYDNQEKRINDYLGLTPDEHILRQKYFRPMVSKQFVGIYNELEGYKGDLEIIKKELADYCNPIID